MSAHAGKLPCDQEPEEGRHEGKTEEATKQAVGVFVPEDCLELGERHAAVEFTVFR